MGVVYHLSRLTHTSNLVHYSAPYSLVHGVKAYKLEYQAVKTLLHRHVPLSKEGEAGKQKGLGTSHGSLVLGWWVNILLTVQGSKWVASRLVKKGQAAPCA